MNILYDYLMKHIGLPYRFGGQCPMTGYDCSGLALEVLNAFGFNLKDQTAQSLYLWCKTSSFEPVNKLGSLVFFGKLETSISHVGIALNDKLMIEAGSGTSQTLTLADAIKQSAYIRIRPITRRLDYYKSYYPKYVIKQEI